jgi:hypothetical protein
MSVTRPVCDTVATVGALDAHVTVRPVRIVPLASLSVSVSWTVPPTGRVAVAGATTTVATGAGGVTVIVAVPAFPSLVAVIIAVPAATAVTRPLADTDATVGALDVHAIVRPGSVPPAESFGVALSCNVWPIPMLPDAGDTCTVATGTMKTVIGAVALLLSLVAVIVPVPAATPETSPEVLTVATLVLLLDHVTGRPVRRPPAESFGVAVSCSVRPTGTLPDPGESCREATGTVVTVIAAVPLLPPVVAVIVEEPGVTLLTKPLAFTFTTAALLLDQTIVRPES